MTLGFIIIFILAVIGAVVFGIQKKKQLMICCILVAIVSFFLLVSVGLLLLGID